MQLFAVAADRRSTSRRSRRIKFSPKASLAWDPSHDWTVRASFGEAWRFPTVGELYQVVTTPVASVPNPEPQARARAVGGTGDRAARRARHDPPVLFNEAIRNALISQTGPLAGTGADRHLRPECRPRRARAASSWPSQRTDLVPRIDLSGSVTYADARRARTRPCPPPTASCCRGAALEGDAWSAPGGRPTSSR